MAVSSTRAAGTGINTFKQVKMIKKIMAGRDKGKRQWRYEEFPKTTAAQKLSSTEHQGKSANRRVTVLNKLFMKNVTDLMCTGVFAEVLYGNRIQISTGKWFLTGCLFQLRTFFPFQLK